MSDSSYIYFAKAIFYFATFSRRFMMEKMKAAARRQQMTNMPQSIQSCMPPQR